MINNKKSKTKRMLSLFSSIILLLVIVSGYSISNNKDNETSEIPGTRVKVIRVIDGDTIEIENKQKVRFIGIDTPETVKSNTEVQPYGKEASDFTKKMLEGKYIYIEKDVSDTDKYGRLLRYIYLEDGTFYNDLLVKEGYAKVSTYPPDVKYVDTFLESQKYAMENNKGLWGLK
ncbi:MAG: thermonuclease family protein [Clostridiaceae bacterium]